MMTVERPTTVQDVQELVRSAIDDRLALEPVGGGTQLHVGPPAERALIPISSAGLTRIIEYSPADLVVVAQAGMLFADLQAILAEEGQMLPIEPALPNYQTLGGIVASRAHSLTRASNGAVRDWLIGVNAVCGDGQTIIGGGKVVKNVAGYDLPKLFCGSWGTLGMITQVAFKTAPLVTHSKVLLVTLSSERNSEEALDALQAMTPQFTIVLNADAGHALLGPDAPSAQYLAVAFAGRPDRVAALSKRATETLAPFAFQILELSEAVAHKLRSILRDFPLSEASLTVRFHILPSQLGAFARMVEWTARRAGFSAQIFGDAACGILWAHIEPRDAEEGEGETRWRRLYADLLDKAERVGGSFIIERMPDAWRAMDIPTWLPVRPDFASMRRLKPTFDPHGIFRPGRFVDAL